jgi:hypothetical protein
VKWFLEYQATSRYAGAARQWLADHPEAPDVSTTSIGPVSAISRELPGDRVTVAYFDKAIGFPSTAARPWAGEAPSLSTKAWSVDNVAEIIRSEREIVLSRPTEARSQPATPSPSYGMLKPGTVLRVDGVVKERSDLVWLRARESQGSNVIYLPIGRDDLPSKATGLLAAKVRLTSRPDGMKSVVDEAPLMSAIDAVRAAQKEIKWAIIVSGRNETPEQKGLAGLRATYIRSVLERRGISGANTGSVVDSREASDWLSVQIFAE